MDWPGAKEIAGRLKKMLPPQLQENDGSPEAQLQQAQSQISQMQPLLQQQHQLVTQLQQEREGKVIEMQTKKEIEIARIQADASGKALQYQTQIAVAQINASKDMNQTIADNELKQLGMATGHAHEVAMSQMEHGQGMEAAQQQAAQQSQQSQQEAGQAQEAQASDQQHQAGMAQQAQEAQQDSGQPAQ